MFKKCWWIFNKFLNSSPTLLCLLVGLSISSCKNSPANLKLLKSKILSGFPSASSINCANGYFYIVGDDSNTVLKLDGDYNAVDSFRLFSYSGKRIPKDEKVDIESSVILERENQYLILFGSGSTKRRKKVFSLMLDAVSTKPLEIPWDQKYEALSALLKSVNIEGSALAGDKLILANRASGRDAMNHLLICLHAEMNIDSLSNFVVRELILPVENASFIGVSDLQFVPSKNILLLTLTTENSANSYDDGEIGDSYIGWITGFEQKISDGKIRLDGMINLSEVHQDFKGEKIEGICLEDISGEVLTLHLVSDNDAGISKMFKVLLSLN